MPPARKNLHVQDDSSTSSKQATASGRAARHTGATHGGSTLKDTSNVDDATTQAGQSANTGLSWANEDLTLLQDYRAAHKMDTPSAFKSFRNMCLLNSALGKQSPTMAGRKKSQRKVTKDQLALAVRKNFNGAAVNEVNVAVDLLYKVKNQNKAFRMRANPVKTPVEKKST